MQLIDISLSDTLKDRQEKRNNRSLSKRIIFPSSCLKAQKLHHHHHDQAEAYNEICRDGVFVGR